jgi:hypothetical protein
MLRSLTPREGPRPTEIIEIERKPHYMAPPWLYSSPTIEVPSWIVAWVNAGANPEADIPKCYPTRDWGSKKVPQDELRDWRTQWVNNRTIAGFPLAFTEGLMEKVEARWEATLNNEDNVLRSLRSCMEC